MASPLAVPPVLAKRGKEVGSRGPQKWVGGEKPWESMALHKKVDVLVRYPGAVIVDEATGGNDSIHKPFRSPKTLLSPDAFAHAVTGKTSEIFNGKRMTNGLSEFASVLEHLNFTIHDGVEREVLHPKLKKRWNKLWTTRCLQKVASQLGTAQYPDEPRSKETITLAVENLLEFSNDIRQAWAYWSEVFSRGAGVYVDLSWVLISGTLTLPGHVKTQFGEQDVHDPAALQKLVGAIGDNPMSVRDFLVEEQLAVIKGFQKKKAKSDDTVKGAVAAPAAVPDVPHPATGTVVDPLAALFAPAPAMPPVEAAPNLAEMAEREKEEADAAAKKVERKRARKELAEKREKEEAEVDVAKNEKKRKKVVR